MIATLPAIGYLWWSDNYGTAAILYTVLLVVAGLANNVLKPLMLGRGVDRRCRSSFSAARRYGRGGRPGFVGATLLALGYQIFIGWVATTPEAVVRGEGCRPPESPQEPGREP